MCKENDGVKVIKRDSTKVDFDKSKISIAILQAMENGSGIIKPNIANEIAEEIYEKYKDVDKVSIYDIEGDVFNLLIEKGQNLTAKAYESYRSIRQFQREHNTIAEQTKEMVSGLSEYWNTENSNKNAKEAKVQRDYMAGIVSTDISRRYLLPPDIIQNHDDGIIHFHDMDYYAEDAINNCFDKSTKFITSEGLKSFEDFKEGDSVKVLSLDGKWHNAIVKKYGTQKLFRYSFSNGKRKFAHDILATENHRWILSDGTETINLKVNDIIAKAPEIYKHDIQFEALSNKCKLLWCKGFGIGDGTVDHNYNPTTKKSSKANRVRIRLCGEKNKYISRFKIDGCRVSDYLYKNGDAEVAIYNYHKEIPEFDNIQEIMCFMNGLYCADGNNRQSKARKNQKLCFRLQSSEQKVIDFVRQYADVCGLYITGERDVTGETTNYATRNYTIGFSFTPYFNHKYRVISKEFVKEDEVWCLEVEDTHNFILQYGIPTGNCCVFNLEDMLQNGTVMNGKMIEKPHRLITATTIATQIITAVSSSQYGGATISLTHLAPFVRDSENRIREELKEEFDTLLGYESWKMFISEEDFEKVVQKRLAKEIEDAVQTFNYQINTMFTVNGQAPFLSVFMYLGETDEYKKELAMLIEEFFKQRIIGIKNETGTYVTQEFPKLLYVLEEDNIHEDSKYWYLTELAAKCIGKRMTPDCISEKIMLKLKGDVYGCMGCRSFLTPDRFTDAGIGNIANALNYKEGEHKYYGRFNQGVVTINLPDVALSSGGNFEEFWNLLHKRLELCHKALRFRHERLLGTPSDVAPILWQHGAFARLKKGERIDELLLHGYSTISLGYAGLYECVKYMTNESHSSGKGKEFGLAVMKALNDACAEWKRAEDIDYSVYGTPIESTTYKFAKCLKNRFGIIKDITDHDYITNSYHINVREEIDPFEKLTIESEYQELSPGGAISYIETPDLTNNPKAIITVMQHIYEHIMYAELNTKSDYCQVCGYDGEIKIIDVDGKLEWECPKCGNRDQNKMNVARRTCGYIGSHFWNAGRTEEIRDRVVHLDNLEYKGKE